MSNYVLANATIHQQNQNAKLYQIIIVNGMNSTLPAFIKSHVVSTMKMMLMRTVLPVRVIHFTMKDKLRLALSVPRTIKRTNLAFVNAMMR